MRHTIATLMVVLTLQVAGPRAVHPRVEAVQDSPAVFEVDNPHGRVAVRAAADVTVANLRPAASTGQSFKVGEVSESRTDGRRRWAVKAESGRRVDVELRVPNGSLVIVRTTDGEVRISGAVASATVVTETGTIATDVPFSRLDYRFTWTESRPRLLSSVTLAEAKEGRAGRYVSEGVVTDDASDKSGIARLNLTTGRGIVLINVNPSEVPSNLQERPLTEAAKAIVRSGDSILTNAIRRVSPKYFGDYEKTLPPPRMAPSLARPGATEAVSRDELKSLLVQVVDSANRAVGDVGASEFQVTESGESREIVDVRPATAPFDLVLLLDVSGSIESYIDFVRKAARAFIDTADPRDRIAIVVFNDDVKVLSGFSGDRRALSASLDTFEAGGGTAYYDALGFVFTDLLERLRNERTAVVVLSDGDDNRSFLPFESLTGTTEESGALIYPLYVPSALIANARLGEADASIDPLRRRYMSLTSKAETEGARLAEISGGRYYPIRQLSEIQLAYDDIVRQLRTAYTVTYRGGASTPGRVRVTVKRDGVYTKARTQPVLK